MAQVAVGYALRMAKGHTFQAPTGTRDFYPADMLRRRYIEKMWRDTSIRHGFEEIDGPTFEHLDLYTVKSGEGIVNELFSFKRAGGEKDYALRPEFTPTLARMYAAKAGGLAKPTKWFTAGPFFRAERPQRGRLREFLQWNCDLIGLPADQDPIEARASADAEMLGCCINLMLSLGWQVGEFVVEVNDRALLTSSLASIGVAAHSVPSAMTLLDQWGKLDPDQWDRLAAPLNLSLPKLVQSLDLVDVFLKEFGSHRRANETALQHLLAAGLDARYLLSLWMELDRRSLLATCVFKSDLARGLAYYTGMVFEVHEAGGKERAIAGGGRYDNLIELFGGPSTPAVGFGMGDVVLSLVLQDKGLMPEGAALMDKLAEPPASPRPDVFVIANDQPESIAAVRPLVAGLRRGDNGVRPLHARHSYKATKNIGKLLQEASACHARFAAILESGSEATLKNLTTGEQVQKVPPGEIAARISNPR